MPAIAGGEHSLYLSPKNSKLYSTGACGLGWCRLHPLTTNLFAFRPVLIPEPITHVHASYYHNLAVTSNNHLYSWGCGTFVEGGGDGVIPALGGSLEDLGGLPQRVPLPSSSSSSNDTISQITGGAYHSAILLQSSNKLLTFGAGQLGQLGRTLTQTDASGLPVDRHPRPVQGLPPNEVITSIGAAFYNTFAVCQSGKLFCAGENQNQQCGGGPKNLVRMTEVTEVRDDDSDDGGGVDQVEGGYCHTLIKKINGHVYSMGCGDDGQRGDGLMIDEDEGDGVRRAILTKVALPTNMTASSVAAGANHSVVLGTNGRAYTFGANDVGQCGVVTSRHAGHTTDEDDDEEEEAGGPVLSPTLVELPPDAGKVAGISAGYAHTVLTTESGRVFVFGQNDNGQLGMGGDEFEAGRDPEARTTPVETIVPDDV